MSPEMVISAEEIVSNASRQSGGETKEIHSQENAQRHDEAAGGLFRGTTREISFRE